MKKTVLILLTVVTVLFLNNLVLAAENNNAFAILEGAENLCPLTDKEARKITSELTVPPEATKRLYKISSEVFILLPDFIYWVIGNQLQTYCLEKPAYLRLSPGAYTVYIIPPQSFLAAEMIKRRALR